MPTIDIAPHDATASLRQAASVTNSLFEEAWWLDAVSPNAWRAVEVERGGEVVARLPFVQKRRYGLTLLGMPRLTQQLGPWIRPIPGKYSASLSWQIQLVEELLASLPAHDVVRLNLYHGFTNWLPFYWAGYRGTVNYTYRLTDLTDLDRIWKACDGSVRTDVQKARRSLTVRDDLSLDEFLRLNAMVFSRQGRARSYDDALVRRIDAACSARGARRVLFAEDSAGRVHAAVYIVWDDRSAYYLMGGSDPALRSSAATTLLLWTAIEHAASVTKVFDFEGSMLRPVERFCRAFGATPVPYFHITKFSRRYAALDTGATLLKLLRRRGPT